jgi:hypothetical protein
MKLLFKTFNKDKGTMKKIYQISSLLLFLVYIFPLSLFAASNSKTQIKDSSTNSTPKEVFEIEDPALREQFGKLPVLGTNIRTGLERITRSTTFIKTTGNSGGLQHEEVILKPAWETDGASFCTIYGTVLVDIPIGYFDKLYGTSAGAELTIIGERWSKWGLHPTLRYRMFRLQTIGKPNQVASVFEGHGLGVGVDYRYGINLPAINRKLYLHAGFFNGLMVMALFSDNYTTPFYDATYMLGVTAGVSIRVVEYIMAMVSFEYMPVFTAGITTQLIAVTFSVGVRI